MNFLALLLGLGIERLLTHLFHLREFRWLDPFFDWSFLRLSRTSRSTAIVAILLVVITTIAPVALLSQLLYGTLADIPYFIFAVVVLLFCLGPRDLIDEGNDFCNAVELGDSARARKVARELVEVDSDSDEDFSGVDRAIYVQANNRIFAVVFWFVLLGPVGAWMFRAVDLLRHRSARQLVKLSHETTQRITAEPISGAAQAIFYLHGVLAWLPSRLLLLGYMLAGSFDGALAALKNCLASTGKSIQHLDVDVLGWAGQGAAGYQRADGAESPEDIIARARAAVDLVRRTLWLIWCPALAILTLYDWLL